MGAGLILALVVAAIVVVGLTAWLVSLRQRSTGDGTKAAQRRPRRTVGPVLSVASAPGFDGTDRGVEINARVGNDGGFTARGVNLEAIVDEQVVAATTVDVPAREEIVVPLLVPDSFVVDRSGKAPRYTGRLALRATYGAATATWEES
jgi:hypothetical protein